MIHHSRHRGHRENTKMDTPEITRSLASPLKRWFCEKFWVPLALPVPGAGFSTLGGSTLAKPVPHFFNSLLHGGFGKIRVDGSAQIQATHLRERLPKLFLPWGTLIPRRMGICRFPLLCTRNRESMFQNILPPQDVDCLNCHKYLI